MNLSRTIEALAAYDAHWGDEYDVTQSGELAIAVGVAYGLDTADRNDPQVCADLIRPGPRTPQPGCELNLVRRMATLHERS